MHTTKVLRSVDFHYWQVEQDGLVQVDFDTFCPHYHAQDRIGVVSPSLEAGVLHTGYALLALTTTFYDGLRARSTDFFDYPQHFAFLDVTEEGVYTQGRRLQLDLETLGGPWGALDVWPDSNWILASGSVGGMLKKVFDWQINRLFWPEDFMPSAHSASLPSYVRAILSARLKTVYYYNTRRPNLEIHVAPPVADMVQRGIARLPHVPGASMASLPLHHAALSTDGDLPYIECYRQVNVQDFLTVMAAVLCQ